MGKLKIWKTIQSKLSSLGKTEEQFIISKDSKDLYVDVENERIHITDFIEVADDTELLAVLSPITNKYYYVTATNKLWKYLGGEWVCVNKDTVYDDTELVRKNKLIEAVASEQYDVVTHVEDKGIYNSFPNEFIIFNDPNTIDGAGEVSTLYYDDYSYWAFSEPLKAGYAYYVKVISEPETTVDYWNNGKIQVLYSLQNIKANIDQVEDIRIALNNETTERANGDGALQDILSDHVNDTSNPHSVTKSQVGLGNVDNTSDANKPISTAMQTALDKKLDKSGGTISSPLVSPLKIERTGTNTGNFSTIEFLKNGISYGHIGISQVDGNVFHLLTDTSKQYPMLDSNNYKSIISTSDSSGAAALSSSDTNYPTVRDIYYGLPNINGSHAYTSGTSIYAPTSTGTSGYELISNGSGTPIWKAPSYAVCSTSASTAAKTASIANFKLVTGATVKIKFTYAHTSSSAATLNVNSTGAKTIYTHSGTSNVSVTSSHSWRAGEIVEFVYDGSYWVAVSSDQGFVQATNEDLSNVLYSFNSNGYAGIDDVTLSLADTYNMVWGFLGENNEFLGLGEVANQVSRLSTTIIVKAGESIQSAIDSLPSTGGKIILGAGTHSVTSKLTCNRNVIFEGMGAGTIINVTNHAFLYNTTSGCRIVLRNMTMNLTGTLDEAYGFINAVSDLLIDNCTISAITTSYNYTTTSGAQDDGTLDYIHCTGSITITNSNITVDVRTYSGECSSFIGQEKSETINNTKISGCNVELYNCYNGGSTSSTSSKRIDLYLLRANGIIANCHFICKGNRANNIYAISNIAQHANIIGCYIDIQNNYASVHSESSVYTGWKGTGKFIGNEVKLNSSYISSDIVIGNKFIKTGTDILHFEGRQPTVVGNKFLNGTTNDIVSYSTDIVFTNNWLRYSCNVHSSSTSLVDNNKISVNLK